MYLAGPSRARRCRSRSITPALAGPYDYGVGGGPRRAPRRSADRPGRRGLRNGARRSSVASRSGCARSRSTSTSPNFMINPTNCSPLTVDSPGDRRPGHGGRLLLLLPRRQLRDAGLQAADEDQPARRPQADQAVQEPEAALRPLHPRGRREHQVALGDALRTPSRSTSATSATSAPRRSWPSTSVPGRTPIGKATDDDAAARSAAPGPAYAVSGSGGLPRLAFILNGQVNLVPRPNRRPSTTAA